MLDTADKAATHLLYRRQFVMGPAFVAGFPGWQTAAVGSGLCLTAHPDLGIVQAHQDRRSVTLLGYILDPALLGAGDDDIVSRLVATLASGGWNAFLHATDRLAGRWILIADDGDRIRLITDPCGFRQVVYSGTDGTRIWCASQPSLLGNLVGSLALTAEAREYVGWYREVVPGWRGEEYWWPGDTTGYRAIRHLLPNHVLDLRSGEVHRFWPRGDLEPRPLEDAVEHNAALLRGIIESASRRSGLALAMTAGRDTRLLLAAARPVAESMRFVTFKCWDMTDGSADVVVPRRLLARLGLSHQVIECPSVMEPWFEELYSRNVPAAHPAYGTIAQGLWHEYPRERLCLKGNASFVMHNFDNFRDNYPHGRPVTLEGLLTFSKVGKHPYAAEAIRQWWDTAGELYNADVAQLFFWETKEGKWQATAQLEWDIVQEVLVPYNCRSFMSNALAVPYRFRAGPTHYFQRRLTAALWPHVLSEPINATSWSAGPVRRAMRDLLVRHGLHRYVRQWRRRSRPDAVV